MVSSESMIQPEIVETNDDNSSVASNVIQREHTTSTTDDDSDSGKKSNCIYSFNDLVNNVNIFRQQC